MPPKGAATHARLIDEAMTQVTVRGLAAVSLQDVAGAAGVSKSAVLKHFQSKEALQTEVVDAMIERFKAAVWDPAEPLPAGRERLDRIFQGELDWIDGEDRPGGCPLKAAAIELDDQPGPLRDLLRKQLQGFRKTVTREFHALRDPPLSEAEAQAAYFQMKSFVLGHSDARRMMGDDDARRSATAAFEALLDRSSRAAA